MPLRTRSTLYPDHADKPDAQPDMAITSGPDHHIVLTARASQASS